MVALSGEFFKQVVRHCRNEYPNEACGILAGKGAKVEQVYEMVNADKSAVTFLMDGKDQLKVIKEIRSLGLEMLGIYHSHIASKAFPSRHDVEMAFYPEASCVIISIQDKNNPVAKSFKIKEGRIEEEELKIV